MPVLHKKRILIISPQDWGTMFVAKHHYAIELAKRGNEVYFLNPPDNHHYKIKGRASRITIEPSQYPDLFLVWHKLYFPYLLKFHARAAFDWLMRRQVKDILAVINKPVDIVWSFDLGNIYSFGNFQRTLNVFHPVDEPPMGDAIKAAQGAAIIFSVTNEILGKYAAYASPKYFIHHGVAEYFLENDAPNPMPGSFIRVGMSGNFLRPDLDRPTLLTIIRDNPEVIFELWGSAAITDKNLGGSLDKETFDFIHELQSLPNVQLHGAIPSRKLAGEFARMDAFLICYDINKDQSKGTNYHKIMEYLAAGKIIISNNVTTFKDRPDLIQMSPGRENNDQLPALFRQVISTIDVHNRAALQQQRRDFARNNTYAKQLERIDELLETLP